MMRLTLVEPSLQYKDAYIEMIEEWKRTGENMTPFVLRFEYEDFDGMLIKLQQLKERLLEDENKVNSTTLWLLEDGTRIAGAVNIRHRLNDYLQEIGGHIGYGVRPSSRRKGYATEMLKQALQYARTLGLRKVLVTCDKDNVGSARTIVNNQGVLDSEAVVHGVEIQRYWIEISLLQREDGVT